MGTVPVSQSQCPSPILLGAAGLPPPTTAQLSTHTLLVTSSLQFHEILHGWGITSNFHIRLEEFHFLLFWALSQSPEL